MHPGVPFHFVINILITLVMLNNCTIQNISMDYLLLNKIGAYK